MPFTYHLPSLYGMESLKKCDFNKAIILGSLSNVEDRLPWQKELADFSFEKINEGHAFLGICFGHQLMADRFGGTVSSINENSLPQNGVRQFEVINDTPLFKKGESFKTIITHSYEVNLLPKDFIHLATSKSCHYEALAHKDLPYYSFQGHPEASMAFVQRQVKKIKELEILKAQKDGLEIIRRFIEL